MAALSTMLVKFHVKLLRSNLEIGTTPLHFLALLNFVSLKLFENKMEPSRCYEVQKLTVYCA
mgnify:CR=1 FL=1